MRILAVLALSAFLTVPAFAQRPANAVAQDGSDSPPLANEFGPQADVSDGLDISVGGPFRQVDNGGNPPGFEVPTDPGAWRINCYPTQMKTIDQIVYPGQKGKSHLHVFFGNTIVSENSTYESLRTTGNSTCFNKLWRSQYWAPALLDGPGPNAKAKWPADIRIYYKSHPASDPRHTPGDPAYQGRVVPLPNGLKLISGKDMVTNTTPSGNWAFKCLVTFTGGELSSDFVPSKTVAQSQCPTPPGGATNVKRYLDVLANMPTCWDGQNLDSPNHRSHAADFITVNGIGQFCPKTHPYVIPAYAAQITYLMDDKFNTSGVYTPGMQDTYFSSDRMPGMPLAEPGTTYHFDLFDAGNQQMKKLWFDHCLNERRSCSGGVLGDGTGLIPDVGIDKSQKPDSKRPKMALEAAHGTVHGPH